MARADLILNLVKTGISGDLRLFHKTVQALAAEERAKKHYSLAERLTELLDSNITPASGLTRQSDPKLQNSYYVITPKKCLDDLVLPEKLYKSCREIVEEHQRRDILRSYNLEPRHRLLLSGPPGNGKTSLAEAMAYELMVPMFVVRYEGIIGSYLGETAQQLDRLFEQVKGHRCVLFFDEFDTLGKERGDPNEVGEIKRVVNSLLLQIDMLPSHIMVIAATNHADMLDKASWRRFQTQIALPKPTISMIEKWILRFEEKIGHGFGITAKTLAQKLKNMSYAEVEHFCLDVQRRYVLGLPNQNIKTIVNNKLKNMNKIL